jgi:DNA mismatch repair protein MutS
MMAQFSEIKETNPDSLLFYRMGDFYELFFEDAVDRLAGARHHADQARQASRRGHPDVRRAGACRRRLPAEADRAQGFPGRGLRTAEDPAEAKKRGSKAVVRRDVTRLVTPGTITEEKLLDPGEATS